MTDAMLARIERHARALVWTIVASAVVLRAILAAHSPWEYGYMWDPYYDTIVQLYYRGHMPAPSDCWECYQPPLFMLVELPFYAFGRLVLPPSGYPHDKALLFAEAVPLGSSFLCLAYCYLLLRWFRVGPALRVIGLALAAALPVLFISSYALEPDLLLGAIISMFVYYLARWHIRPDAAGPLVVARIGLLAGLAAATRYSGLVAPILVAMFFGARLFTASSRRRAAAQLAIVCAVTVAFGSWRYVTNVTRYGTPLYSAHTSANFHVMSPPYWRQYQFTTFRLSEILALTRPDAPPGMLTIMPVYNSVWTTLHGLMWNDLGFFTNPTRHGTALPLYSDRHVSPRLASSVIVLGLLPTALAGIGFVVSVRRRAFRPIALLALVGMAVYLQWVISQPFWALKAKYLLFLLTAWVLYVAIGLRWVVRVMPAWISVAVVSSMAALIVLANLYLLAFALG